MDGNGKMKAVQAAVEDLMHLVADADGREMVSRRTPKPLPGGDAPASPEECPACADGTCVEHMSDEDMSALGG